MKKWIRKGTAAILAVSLLIGQAVSAGAAGVSSKQEETLKIASLSDTHYLSPDMIADTADFTEHLNSDRKMFAESDAFLTALLNTIKEDNPDVLLISGDLTKDGEKEGHEDLAEKLEKFRDEEMPDLHIYITPGNHDLNNSNAMNFNTDSGEAEPAGRTTQADYKAIYADLTYNDETVIDTFTPAEGKQAGGLSYVARPKAGFTIISIDSARYSADNTESGTDEHETSGAISADLEKWVVEQVTAAKQRGDTVIGLQHHGMVPHFSMEPDLLPMYLINDYERLAQVYADAGMQYIFTGHMHANDIATVTTQKGNTLYDIETGSVVTYPSPARSVTITRTIENSTVSETMNVKTYTGVGPITFTNPVTGQEQTIADITEYGRQHGFSNDMLTTTVNGFLHGYYDQIAAIGSKAAVEQLINDLLGDSELGSLLGGNITVEKLIDVALPLLLPSTPEEGADIGIYYEDAAIKIWALGEGAPGTDPNGLWISIPTKALKEALIPILETVDGLLKDKTVLDEIVEDLVNDLVTIPVYETEIPEETKTLLDYVNYIYQSHLGGEDNAEQPAWVTAATEKVESGELLDTVLDLAVTDLADALNKVLDQIPLNELLGATGWNMAGKEWIPMDGRTVLLQPLNENTESMLNLIALLVGWTNEGGNYIIPADYSVADLLTRVNQVGGLLDINIDLEAMLQELLLGTPADPEAGTEATEGLIDAEIKGQINTWLLNLVDSMGTDSNYPQDNTATITCEWKLLTDRTALDAAIAEAEALDLTPYTTETAQAVTEALAAAKALSLTASQTEMDAAAKALNDAVAALEKVTEGGNTDTEIPDDSNTETPDNGNTEKPGEVPQTGDTVTVLPIFLLMLSSVAVALTLYCKKKTYDR